MDLITQTSLEALLLKATNPQNQNIDTAAVEAFCMLVNKEKDGAHIGVKVIANGLPSGNEKEMLQILNVLDTCMARCGSQFQSEVGKFRFLNEMIKLVSPKYLGSQTPLMVKQKVLQLMYMWTLDYPKESKIKEAYDMLRKQGVIRETPNPNVAVPGANAIAKRKSTNSVFHDEEKSKILQKLLQSKDPEDIQAANWLIKSMVKEDDKRAELKSKRISELESVQNNVRLLNEMLDSYRPNVSSADELDLIRELHQSCERLRPNILKLASETQQTEEILGSVLETSDELSRVFGKYGSVILKGTKNGAVGKEPSNYSLLDFEANGDASASSSEGAAKVEINHTKEIDVLSDILNTSSIPGDSILQPIAVLQQQCDKTDISENKFKALEDLDVLSEHLMKENLQSKGPGSFSTKNQGKTPMNLLTKPSPPLESATKGSNTESLNFDLNFLLNNKPKEEPKITNNHNNNNNNNQCAMDNGGDDVLVDISDEKMLEASDETANTTTITKAEKASSTPMKTATTTTTTTAEKQELKLSDIFIKLEDIKPSSVAPLTIMNERNGISITLHFARDKPRDDVRVFVVTTVNKNEMPISNYLFQAVVPKGCKMKLQPPSTTTLPAYNPFLPPAAITQILLIASPENVQIFLKFIVSYSMDEETFTEMGEVENLFLV